MCGIEIGQYIVEFVKRVAVFFCLFGVTYRFVVPVVVEDGIVCIRFKDFFLKCEVFEVKHPCLLVLF